jgi:hypothetical protein
MYKIVDYLNSDVSFTPAVIGYLIHKESVLLGMRKKVSTGMGTNLIAGIGGKIGDSEDYKNETFDEGLVREMKEEIQVTPTQYNKLGRVRFIWPDNLKWNQDVRIYIVEKWEGEPTETEAIKPNWYQISNLPLAQMWEDNAYWVPKSLEGVKVDMIFLIGNDNKTLEMVSY